MTSLLSWLQNVGRTDTEHLGKNERRTDAELCAQQQTSWKKKSRTTANETKPTIFLNAETGQRLKKKQKKKRKEESIIIIIIIINLSVFYFLLTFSRTKLNVVLLWILLVSVFPLSKSEISPPLSSVMPQALQHGASWLQTTSANLWTFSINMTSPFRIHFPLLSPIEFTVPATSITWCIYCFNI
jgi:hypothetical protein